MNLSIRRRNHFAAVVLALAIFAVLATTLLMWPA
jgi:hypothetical protein